MSQIIFAGKAGPLEGYNLNIVFSINSYGGYQITMTDNFSSLPIIKSYGFNNNNTTYVFVAGGDFGSLYNNTYKETWPFIIPENTPFTTNSATMDPLFTNFGCITPYLNGNWTPSSGSLPAWRANFFQLGDNVLLKCNNNVYIRVNTGGKINIQPIPFVLNLEFPGSSAFVVPLPLPLNQISTITLPTAFGILTGINWTANVLFPDGSTITPASSTDPKGNFTALWQNTIPGDYILTIGNSLNWSTSMKYTTGVHLSSKNKYRKLIKRSKKKNLS